MKRVIVIGNNGSGKSIFAVKLGKKLKLPVIHLDKLFHKPGWKRATNEEWDEIQKQIIQEKEWIIDGTYKRTLDVRLKAADTVVFIDIPKWLAFIRAIKRRIAHRHKTRPDLPDYLKEQMSLKLIKKILFFSRAEILRRLNDYKGKTIIILHNNEELESFIRNKP